jgi:alkylhydroperoxidase family enzyme
VQRAVQSGQQIAEEGRLAELDRYEESDLFTEREKVALRYTDVITWNPGNADDKLWADLHQHFTEPELVELGAFIGFIAGGQRWIHTLNVKHGEVLFETTTGLSEQVTKELQGVAQE